jgi:UDP-N-acetylmuramoylalanine--D-glutamate ligase
VKIAILGFGIEGHSTYEYWNKPENDITICDQNESADIPVGVKTKLGPTYLNNLAGFDILVRTASLNPALIIGANNQDILDKVTTNTNEFFRVSPTKNIIGITGTKGKGTTSTLVTKLLQASGHTVHLGGNIGNGAIELLKHKISPTDWVVLELSSYQLMDFKHSPLIGVCLMVVPEHLNWHLDLSDYLASKANLFKGQAESDKVIFYADNQYSKQIVEASHAHKIPYLQSPGAYVDDNHFVIGGQVICSTDEVKLIGKHNWQNICAALTIYWQVDQNTEIARQVVTNFSGLEHRLELVRELDGVKYYNDSFASVPDATMAAVEAIEGPKVVIIGGFDRGLELVGLAAKLKEHNEDIAQVIVIGESSQRLRGAFEEAGFSKYDCNS